MNKSEIQTIIKKGEYGAVLAMKIWQRCLFLYYENNSLCIYDTELKKMMVIVQIEENVEMKEFFIADYITILKKDNCIQFLYQNEKFSMTLHSLKLISCDGKRKKEIGKGWIFESGYDNSFKIYNEDGINYISGNYNNWVSDACIINKKIYTVSYDGCIKSWRTDTGKCDGYYAIKRGWLTTICYKNDQIFIGTQYGEVFVIDIEDLHCQGGVRGAIWNIYQFNNRIYTVSEDGKIALFNNNLSEIKCIVCSNGWVNALTIYENKILAVTSNGELISIDTELTSSKIICKEEKWFNNLVVRDNNVYIITAEGYVLVIDMKTKDIVRYKISTYQLIDILIVGKEIVVADVEGTIYFIDLKFSKIRELQLNRLHITSMCFNKKENILYVATLDNVVVFIDVKNKVFIKMLDIGQNRIWKIDYSQEFETLALTTTSMKVVIFSKDILGEMNTESFITTCKIVDDYIVCGNDKGEMEKYCIREKLENKKPNMQKSLKKNTDKLRNINDKIVIVCDKNAGQSRLYEERDKTILKMCGYKFEEWDIGDDEMLRNAVIECSGWAKFPQLLFYGHFIASGSVLPQMYSNGTLCRCVENIKLKRGKYGK